MKPASVPTVVAGALLAAPAIWAQPTILKYPYIGGASESIASGADGRLWFLEAPVNRIGAMTPAGALTEFTIPTSNASAQTIVAGPDGALWFTEYGASKIGRITTAGTITEYPLPKGGNPYGIASGPDGNIWFAELNGHNIGRITPSGVFTEYVVANSVFPQLIATGPGGDLWFSELNGHAVGRVTATGTITEYPLPAEIGNLNGMTPGPDGNLWFSWGYLGSISPTGVVTQYQAVAGSRIVAGPDGYLWYVTTEGALGRIDTSGVFANYTVPNGAAVYLTRGPDGNVWFSEGGYNQIGEVVLATVQPFAPLTLSVMSLAFSTSYGSNPASQSFMASAPSTTPINVSWQTPSGPYFWLSATPSGSATTNATITASADAAGRGVPVGTYSASVSVTTTKDGGTHIVPVTLTVTPTTGNAVSTSMSVLPYNYIIGGTPVQAYTPMIASLPSSNPAVPVTVSTEVNSPAGGNWLWLADDKGQVITPTTTLTTPVEVHVNVDPTGLTPGSYSATLTVSPAGAAPISVPVTLSVTAMKTISATPARLHFVAAVGGAAPAPQAIQVTGSDPAMGFSAFPVASTSNDLPWLSWSRVGQVTPAVLNVSVSPASLAEGTYSAVFDIIPDAPQSPDVQIPIDLTIGNAPYIAAVVNAASFSPGAPPAGSLVGAALAPGEVVTITGTNLGPVEALGLTLDAAGKVATSAGGVTVTIDNVAAPLLYVSDRQINCVVPYETAASFGNVTVTNGVASNQFIVSLAATVPGVFSASGSGSGAVAALNASGQYNGPDNPAPQGSTVTFYLTGEGQTNPTGITGAVTSVSTSASGPLTPQPKAGAPAVMIGGLKAAVTFFGEAPGIVSGVLQLNVQIPFGLSSGAQPLTVSVGGTSAQSGLTIFVR